MAQKTELSLMGVPGQQHLFVAKTATVTHTGPIDIIALDSYQMGPVALGSYQMGPGALGSYQMGPGALGGIGS